MNIKDLKNAIINDKVSDEFKIFVAEGDNFLANQYVDEISRINNLSINKINSLSEIVSSAVSLVFNFNSYLNLLCVEEFNEILEDYDQLKNTIVICNKINKIVIQKVEDYIINFPKLTDWQIKDYIKIQCAGLDTEAAEMLYSACAGNIFRIVNELDKIKLFDKKDRQKVATLLAYSDYSDINSQTIFNLSEAIIKKDLVSISKYLLNEKNIYFDSFGLISILVNKLKQILLVNFNGCRNFEEIGLSTKQVNAIRYYYKSCSEDYLLSALKFLTGIDKKIKTGRLDIDNLNSYIICQMLNF